MMLVHIDQPDVAEKVHNGWLKALEDGIHTYDVHDERVSRQKVGTREFAEAVVARLGRRRKRSSPSVRRQPRPSETAGPRRRASCRYRRASESTCTSVEQPDTEALAARLLPLAGPESG